MSKENNSYSVIDVGESQVPYVFPCRGAPTVLQTPLQTAVMADTIEYGPALFIGEDVDHLAIQSTVADEGLYHRAFVHGAAALCVRAPCSALVIGGGEGCMARELLKYDTIEVIDQVDWDGELLAYFKQPAVAAVWNGGAYEDPRVRVHVEDAFKSTVWEGKMYDLVLIDLCDPSAETIGDLEVLLQKLSVCRAPGGVLLMNAGPILPPLILDVKSGRTAPPGFYSNGGHICYTYSSELLETMRWNILGGSGSVFRFALDVPSFKAPWSLIGIAESSTIGNWSAGFITEGELKALLNFQGVSGGFYFSKKVKRVEVEVKKEGLDYPLYCGC